ncbi:hypothetical protein CSUI_006777 [Cystoisospora suis]|uniref:Uncharacterized protein n=1 Tax=Cystoisospora suis TaxID=483139 RepID=A0A2C6KSB0_9APIC|nr:hypothetical protein CSUI_006777 [Cystoisospora suis]
MALELPSSCFRYVCRFFSFLLVHHLCPEPSGATRVTPEEILEKAIDQSAHSFRAIRVFSQVSSSSRSPPYKGEDSRGTIRRELEA